MAKFTIVNATLQITIAETSILYTPTLYIGLESLSLYESVPQVVLYNIMQGTNVPIFDGKLSDCTDSNGTPFTLSTFLAFASTNFGANSFVSNGLTDAQLRATPVPISGTVTANTGLTQPLTDTQLRATPVPISGTISSTQSGTWNINNVSGIVSLPTGASTEATLSDLNSKFTSVTRTPSIIRVTNSGTISAGARSISVFNAGNNSGSILGGTNNILSGEEYNFSAGGENDVLSAFQYDATSTTLVITSIF